MCALIRNNQDSARRLLSTRPSGATLRERNVTQPRFRRCLRLRHERAILGELLASRYAHMLRVYAQNLWRGAKLPPVSRVQLHHTITAFGWQHFVHYAVSLPWKCASRRFILKSASSLSHEAYSCDPYSEGCATVHALNLAWCKLAFLEVRLENPLCITYEHES